MKSRKKDKKNLIKVGIFIAGLTLVLMGMIASIGNENSVFEPKVTIRARVENVSNLKPGSYVELKGIRIGSVEAIEIISHKEVEIAMEVLEKELKWIRTDSHVAVSTAGLVGDKFLEIRGGSEKAPPLNPETDMLSSSGEGSMETFIAKGKSIAEITEGILSKLDQILISLNEGNKLNKTMNSLQKASSNLEKVSSELSAANMGEMVRSVNKASGAMERIMTRIEKGPGTMNSLIYDDILHEDLRALLGGAQRNKVIKYFIRQSIKNSERRKSEED
jgi:phospholipid/cholesterol/gamma-HCH transport system substrate-binding protein